MLSGILAGLGEAATKDRLQQVESRKNLLQMAAQTWSHIAQNPDISPEGLQHAIGNTLLAATADPNDEKGFKQINKRLSDLTPIHEGIARPPMDIPQRQIEAQNAPIAAEIPPPNVNPLPNLPAIQAGAVPSLDQQPTPVQTPPPSSFTAPPVTAPLPPASYFKTQASKDFQAREAGRIKAETAAMEDEAKYAAAERHKTPAPPHYADVVPGATLTRDGVPVYTAPPAAVKPTGDFEKVFLPAYAAKLKKTEDTLTPDETMQAVKDYAAKNQDPEMRDLMEQQRRNAITLQTLQMGQIPTKDDIEFYADQLVNHRMAPSQIPAGMGVQGQAFRRNVEILALRKNPDFNMQEAESEYALVKSPAFQQQIRFIDHVNNTLPRLEQAAKKLGNTSVKGLNALLTKGQEQFGGTNIKTFLADRDIVANELGRVLSGGGTGNQTSDVKIAAAQRLISETDSPAQIVATLAEIRPLLKSRRQTLTSGTYLANVDTATIPEVPSPSVAHKDGDTKVFTEGPYKGKTGVWSEASGGYVLK